MNASRELETERLSLRWLTEDDADLMLGVWNDPAFVRYVGDRGVRDVEQARAALRDGVLKLYADLGFGPYRVATRNGGTPLGICGLFKRDNLDDPDIGFGLLAEHCRQGYAYEAAVAVLETARDDMQLDRVTAIVSPENEASIALIDKLGLQFVERMRMPGEDHDVLLYAIEWQR